MKKKVKVRVRHKTEFDSVLQDVLNIYSFLGRTVYYLRDKEQCCNCILNDDCDSQWSGKLIVEDVISDFWVGEETGGRIEFYLRDTPCGNFHLDDFGKVLFFDKNDIKKGE